jgi:hypothetical protein
MSDEIDWADIWKDADRYNEQRKRDLAKRGGVQGEFFKACLAAYEGSKEEKLVPTRNTDGDFAWTVSQGSKAACFAREDAAASLMLQMFVLNRLNGLRRIAWLGIALLLYIAYQVT